MFAIFTRGGMNAALIIEIPHLFRVLGARGGGRVCPWNQMDDMVVDMIRETRTWVLVAFALLLGSAHLRLPYANWIAQGMKLVFLWQAAVWAVIRSGSEWSPPGRAVAADL